MARRSGKGRRLGNTSSARRHGGALYYRRRTERQSGIRIEALSVPHVQTKKEIQGLLEAAGLRPRKRFGQHFLIDGNLMRRLVDVAQIDHRDVVLEVGPGTGGLTDLLAPAAAMCICVEIDRDLQGLLAERFADAPSVHLVKSDVLESKHRLAPRVADLLERGWVDGEGRAKLVANLPYQVATPLVMNLLVDYPQVRRLCFTVQAEVGDRMTAPPGGRDFGPLAVIAQCLARLQVVARLPPAVFWPRPAVDSVMVRMDLIDPPFADRESVRGFAHFVRTIFEHRRKSLRAAVGHAADEKTRDRVCAAFDGSRRPESFGVEEWLAMYRAAGAG